MDNRGSLKPVPDGEIRFPEREQDREAIRVQLGRLLASPLFARSKGCSNLLAHIVSRTLDGDAERLKERTLGVEVFGRAPDYDTASDHVVRSTASEVRKRLAQYYTEPGRSGETRIDVPNGSYVPRFGRSVDSAAAPSQDPGNGATALMSATDRELERPGTRRSRTRTLAILIVAAAVVLFSAAAIWGRLAHSDERTLNRFWRPVLQSQQPVLLCIGDWNESGQPVLPGSPRTADEDTRPSGAFSKVEKVFFNDAVTLAKIAGWLQENGRQYRILPHSRVAFADLQTRPVVLIGLLNNSWTASLGSRLRFTVERGSSSDILILRDKKNPARNDWSVDMSTPYNQPTKDYALIVRELDPQTGQTVVTVGGITHLGTIAASDFLTSPDQMRKMDAYGRDWERKNVAIVLSTEVIKGSPGSAKIVATDFW